SRLAQSLSDANTTAADNLSGGAKPVVSFTPGLFGADETQDNIPFVEINHLTGCCCIGCGGMPPEDLVLT
ncbi:hypothetical protein, partial [Roseobacter litoralis]